MDVRQAYNTWSRQYDTNINKTRDLEAKCLRVTLENLSFENCLEIGCGTGKNTEFLVAKAKQVMAIDLSEEMLAKAKEKISATNVEFKQADITKEWAFATGFYDLVTFSLVLEHVQNLEHIFSEVSKVLKPGGLMYIGELHPFKQYSGSKARFEHGDSIQVVECYNHHISDFTRPAKKYGLEVSDIDEYFDEDNRESAPRILCLKLIKA